MITLTAATHTAPTPTTTARLCDYCGTPMEQHGRSWVCPKQRDEEKRVSQTMRVRVATAADARVDTAPF